MLHKMKRTGFSLIELVVVICIIGVIAIVVIPNFYTMIAKNNETTTKANIKRLREACEMYFGEYRKYDQRWPDRGTTTGAWTDDHIDTDGNEMKGLLVPTYIERIPEVVIKGKGSRDIKIERNGAGTITDAGGWVYCPRTGEWFVNLLGTNTDTKGIPYSSY